MSSMKTYTIDGYKFVFLNDYESSGVICNHPPEHLDNPEYVTALRTAFDLFTCWYPAEQVIHDAYSSAPSSEEMQMFEAALARCKNPHLVEILRRDLEQTNEGRIERKRAQDAYAQQRRESEMAGFVYLAISDTGVYKIGTTKNPKTRIRTLHRFGVKDYICCIETHNAAVLERDLHKRFETKRIAGEWFELEPHDIEYIKSLQGE